jgi:hypothetical protein
MSNAKHRCRGMGVDKLIDVEKAAHASSLWDQVVGLRPSG